MTEILDKVRADIEAAKRKSLQKLLRLCTEGEREEFKRTFGNTVTRKKLDAAILMCVQNIRAKEKK